MTSTFFRLNCIDVSMTDEGVLMEWDGKRVGVERDVWDGLKGSDYEKVMGISHQVVERGLVGDITVLLGEKHV